MTREDAKVLWPIIKAWGDGATLQFRQWDGRWVDVGIRETLDVSCSADHYRLKPQPKYRPWKPEEAVGKVVRHKIGRDIHVVVSGYPNCIGVEDFAPMSEVAIFETFQQLDGSPCGVLEDA